MKKTTVLQITLVFYGLFSLLSSIGTITVSNSAENITGTATAPSTSGSAELLQTFASLAIAGLIELYKRLKDRGWPNKYKGVIVARPL